MKNVILASNPYRDKNFQNVREAMGILKAAGISARLCLPFDVDRSFELPKDLRFSKLDRELGSAELIICFGGDGTILHMAKSATRRGIPLLGVNLFRFTIQGLGYSNLAVIAGVFEMIARGAVAALVAVFGFTAVCYARPAAWVQADCFLIPAYFVCMKSRTKEAAAVRE